MADLRFVHDHNMTAFLGEPPAKHSEFLEHVEESIDADGNISIVGKIQGHSIIISEQIIRDCLQFGDKESDPVELDQDLVNRTVYQMGHEGAYPPTEKKLLHPYWRYLAHVVTQCLSGRKGGYDVLNQTLSSCLKPLILVSYLTYTLYMNAFLYSFGWIRIKKSGNYANKDSADGGSAGDGGANVNIVPLLRTLAKGASVTLGGIFSITMISSTTVALFTLHRKNQIGSQSSSSMSKKNASSCDVCRSKGFKDVSTVWGADSFNKLKKSMCGLSSSEVFFFLAAVTGCISVIINMNLTDAPMDPGLLTTMGDSTANSAFKFGSTYVVEPKGKHQATIVWLHGLGDDGSSWSQVLETLSLPNIKWTCPTSPVKQLTIFGGSSTTACLLLDDSQTLLCSSIIITITIIKLGVGGFSMGAATAIYSAICFSCGNFGNGTGCPIHIHLDTVVGLSSWLPCARALSNKVKGRASLPILLCHGRADDMVRFRYGEK
ncbi:hypothetical protein E3N88_40858 [Mikania micrantha]|uniref:Phospholipase/carboxylesterase/thioesterase domain-containing protein n=1 Tax=Mikania micrantha TaxID=192012 RepID=A0A5N6LPT3_9ASTR|nr:hypothetical protein E3N88_40858 [Mikania micrantha]